MLCATCATLSGGRRSSPRRCEMLRRLLGGGLQHRARRAARARSRREVERLALATRRVPPRTPSAQRRRSLLTAASPFRAVASRGALRLASKPHGQERLDGPRRQSGEATRPGLPVERDLRRLPFDLGLRAARRAAQAQREGRLVALDGAAPRRRRRPRRRHPHGAQGLGGERPRRDVHRPARRLPQLQGAVPRRPAAGVGRVPELRREGHRSPRPASST